MKCYICGIDIHEANLTYKDRKPVHMICMKEKKITKKVELTEQEKIIKILPMLILRVIALIIITMYLMKLLRG